MCQQCHFPLTRQEIADIREMLGEWKEMGEQMKKLNEALAKIKPRSRSVSLGGIDKEKD